VHQIEVMGESVKIGRREIRDFDDILDHIRGWSRYQLILMFISLPFAMMILAYSTYTPVLFLYTPGTYQNSYMVKLDVYI
jgi:hypothetical protein